jgi:guanylate cyclase
MLIDFSLVRFVVATFPNSADALVHYMRILLCFPSQTDFLERLMDQMKGIKTLSTAQQYWLWQFSRVRVLRLTASTPGAAVKTGQLLKLTRELSTGMQQFWASPTFSLEHLQWTSGLRRQLDAQWMELLEEFPNATAVLDGFCEFQLESSSRFHAAAQTKHRIDLIGKSSWKALDKCFVAFARMFPIYLKNGVLTHAGAFARRGGSGTHSSSKGGAASSDGNFAAEAYLENGVLRHARLRLALESPLNAIRPAAAVWLFWFGIVAFCMQLAAFAAVIGSVYLLFDSAIDRLVCSRAITACRLSIGRSVLYTLLAFANETGRFVPDDDFHDCYLMDQSDRRSFQQLAQTDIDDAIARYAEFVVSLSAVAQTFGAYLTTDVIAPNIPIPLCQNGRPVTQVNFSLTAVIVAQVSHIGSLLLPSHNWTDGYVDNPDFCMAINSVRPIADSLQTAQERLFDDYLSSFEQYSTMFSIAAAAVPCAMVVLTYIFAPICAIAYMKEVLALYAVVMSHDTAQRVEAARPLGNQYIHMGKSYIPPASSRLHFIHGYSLVLFAVFVAQMAMGILALIRGRDAAERIAMLERFTHSSNTRLPRTTEAAVHVYNAWLGKGTESSMVNPDDEFERVMWLADKVHNATIDIQTTSTGGGSIMGIDAELDELVLSTNCHLPELPRNLHDLYNCSYTTHLFVVFRRLLREVLQALTGCDGVITGIPLTTLHHLVTTHFASQHSLMDSQLSTLVSRTISDFKLTLILCSVIGMLIACAFFLILQLFQRELTETVEAALALIKRIAPQMIATNTALLDWLRWRSAEADRHALTAEQSVLHLSHDGVLCVTRDLMIEYINPAITQFLGYSPEQKLGCSLTTMLTVEAAAQMEILVRQLGEEPVVLSRMDCVAEGGTELAFQAVCFPLKQDRSNERCIIVLTDIRERERMRLAAEAAQAETERLANAVLPPELARRADAGEPAFSVPVASVMAVSLGRFDLEHASPQEVMPKLTHIFLTFEQRMMEFPLVTKVRVFGESFLCAAGLFGGELGAAVDQIVMFAQNCMEILEDVNVKNYAQHTVRIGINTGGPIICGIMGEAQSGFDVFGSPVTMAMNLQRTAPVNSLQLSDSTFQLIDATGYHATKRVLKIDGQDHLTHLLRMMGSSADV